MINISVRGAERRYLLPDSFASRKNASNESNFIDFGGGDAQLKNYPLYQLYIYNYRIYLFVIID